MKKLAAFIGALAMAVGLIGCTHVVYPERGSLTIESHEWVMHMVQSMEKNGQIVAYGADYAGTVPQDAVTVALSCQAANGQLTLQDATKGQTYQGSYELMESSAVSTVYKITIEEKRGTAVVSATTYADGSQTTTLIMSFENTAIHFFEATHEPVSNTPSSNQLHQV